MSENFFRNKISLKTRAEEIGDDVSDRFIIPPFYNRLDILYQKKPRVIIGGRGSGKTMLLRHFCHNSMFSKQRKNVSAKDLEHIGLYKRFDTQFCKMMFGRNVDEDDWENAFSHYIALSFTQEVVESLESIAYSDTPIFNFENLNQISFGQLQIFNNAIPSDFAGFKDFVREQIWAFEAWVSNVRREDAPKLFPYNFLERLIDTIKEQVPATENSIFYVYIDEFENLRESQKRLINTRIKHSSAPIIFNYAMKRVATPFRETTGDEQINEPDDYKVIDLDKLLQADDGKNFQIFAAEILFAELQSQKLGSFGVDLDTLKDAGKLEERLSSAYRDKLLSRVRVLFPELSHSDLAKQIVEDSALSKKLLGSVEDALKNRGSKLKAEAFFDASKPRASVIMPALLNRERYKPEEVLNEFNKYKKDEKSNFKDWIHNNFIASYLQFFHAIQRKECPLYTGFETFCRLSHDNIRHLLVICENSLQYADSTEALDRVSINPEQQSRGARLTSSKMLAEVKGFGSFGLKLHQFVSRIGYIFELDHQRPTLSENERNHFAIISDKEAPLSDISEKLLEEAEKWSVLFKSPVTKKKNKDSPDLFEYQLNPIFAPHFLISYRRRQRMELSAQVVEILFNGKLEEYSAFIKDFRNSFLSKGQQQSLVPTLFDNVEEISGEKK